MTSIKVWLKASRLQSQSYIFLPLLFGQAWFISLGNDLKWPVFIIICCFSLFDQLFIVYANDYADYETDCKNQTFNIFSGGSRVLADRDLFPEQLKNSSLLMATLCIFCGVLLSFLYNRLLSVPLVITALTLLWMYSYNPFKLSYRGGGEFLQMMGVGLVLPLFGYYAQSGSVSGFPWQLLSVILPTQLACAMATSLPDEPSDRASSKKTTTVLLGQRATKILIIVLNITGIILYSVVGRLKLPEVQVYYILSIPVAATSLQLFFINSKPGSFKLTLFVFLAVLVTLSIMGGMAISLLI